MDALQLGANRARHEHIEPQQAPPAVIALLVGAVPMVMALQFCAAVLGAAVVPVFDAAPVGAVFVAIVARPWRGVARRWFTAVMVLGIAMLIEWVPIWVLLGFALSGRVVSGWPDELLSYALFTYLVESVLLLALTMVASGASVVGIARARKATVHDVTAAGVPE